MSLNLHFFTLTMLTPKLPPCPHLVPCETIKVSNINKISEYFNISTSLVKIIRGQDLGLVRVLIENNRGRKR